MKINLKPCPFCGTNNAELRHDKSGYSFVLCVKDGCYIRTDGHLNDNAAIDAWNKRANEFNNNELKPCEMVGASPMDYVRVALALETLAYHNKNYLSKCLGDNGIMSREIQSLLIKALKISEGTK